MNIEKTMGKIFVCIPAYNEENNIPETLSSLSVQSIFNSNYKNNITLVLFNNNSTDKTLEQFIGTCKSLNINKYLIFTIKEKGIVATRRDGCKALLEKYTTANDIIAFIDADTTAHYKWLEALYESHQKGYEMVTTIGFFQDSFWLENQEICRKYYDSVGDIFFSSTVKKKLLFPKVSHKFGHKMYYDFCKPPAGTCFSMTVACYKKLGGYSRVFMEDGSEVFGETWNMILKSPNRPSRSVLNKDIYFETSPRRMIFDTVKFENDKVYDGMMNDFRSKYTDDDLLTFKRVMKQFNYNGLIDHVIKYYLLLPCIIDKSIPSKASMYLSDNIIENIELFIAEVNNDSHIALTLRETYLNKFLTKYKHILYRCLLDK